MKEREDVIDAAGVNSGMMAPRLHFRRKNANPMVEYEPVTIAKGILIAFFIILAIIFVAAILWYWYFMAPGLGEDFGLIPAITTILG